VDEKAIILFPGRAPRIVGAWQVGEYYRALEVARAFMDGQVVRGLEPEKEETPAPPQEAADAG
jgi:hypothetical protein